MSDRREDTALSKELQDLAKNLGVRRLNLAKKLGEELHKLWHVSLDDSSDIARAKVTWQLERLIDKLVAEEHQRVARTSYNLDTIDIPEGERSTAEARHGWMQKNKGWSYSYARSIFHTEIIPEFVGSLRTNSPPPTGSSLYQVGLGRRGELTGGRSFR